jgi:hypothetical protein
MRSREEIDMPELVTVSSIDTMEKLKAKIEELFKKGQYVEITQAIGMYSLLIDPQHTISDQAQLYRMVLNMIKVKIRERKTKTHAAWYEHFPKLMDEIVSSGQIVTDAMSAAVISDHYAAYGSFKSLEDFFLWALDDRRLTLDQIVKYIEKTAEIDVS